MTTTIALTRNGKLAAVAREGTIEVVDMFGIAPAYRVAETGACAWVGDELWVAGTVLQCRSARSQRARRLALPGPVVTIRPYATGAVLAGFSSLRVEAEAFVGETLASDAAWWPVHGRRLVAARAAGCELVTLGQRAAIALPVTGELQAVAAVFAGRGLALVTRTQLVVASATGALIHARELGLASAAIAEDAGLVVGQIGTELVAVDARTGAARRGAFAGEVTALAVDGAARRLALVLASGELRSLPFDEVFRRGATSTVPAEPDAPHAPALAEVVDDEPAPIIDAPTDDPIDEPAPIADAPAPAWPPLALALHAAPALPAFVAPEGALPFAHPGDHAMALVELVAARVALAIAERWHSGRFSREIPGGLPHEHEVLGLVGEGVGLAPDAMRRARARLAERASTLGPRVRATLAAGVRLPFVDIAVEYELSPLATELLAFALAPRLRADVARLYAILGNGAGGSCDLELAAQMISGDADTYAQVLAEITSGPLARGGLVQVDRAHDRITFAIDDGARDRLLGVTAVIASVPAVAELVVPLAVVRTLRSSLAHGDRDHPVRVVVRGRPGSGRHTLIAAFAREVDRGIARIDASRPGVVLERELARARLAHLVPVVSGLDCIDEAGAREDLRRVLAAHPGPIAFRAPLNGELPLDPDHVAVVLPALSISERAQVWGDALARHELVLEPSAVEQLASRYRFGPGTIERVCATATRRARLDPTRLLSVIEEHARQHLAMRLGKIASRVERLPDWDQVRLPDDMLDSVRELVGRVRHQRVVYESWGFERKLTTGRGTSALFYGPPGTGKTLVAGLLARELGLELWRVDLGRVLSKWIGETERNLAEVFDAAEDGQVMLLFDEADSLFTRRTEVKSSNDRYANVEVNYLLQRLDTFEGVVVLTTNLEKSIDPAFKRRMTMRLYFPFPDEEQRAQLWASHLPAQTTTTGTFDFGALARRYPLSGGYIRNSAVRAAFLAAQERRPLSQAHLVRAVELEYRELGKLSTSGPLE